MKKKEYCLLGLKINVTYIDRAEVDGDWVFGFVEYIADVNNIFISTKDKNGNPLTKESMEDTLRHELFHVILTKGQYHSASSDEPMIEWLALCTSILHKQGLKI